MSSEEIELERINKILISMESKYPKNTKTEQNLKELNTKITKLYNKLLKNSIEIHCKSEYENLSKYADINENGIDVKPDAEENIVMTTYKNFQNCFQSKNSELTKLTQNLENDFNLNNEELDSCVNRSSLNSTVKSNADIENSIYECLKSFEGNYLKIAINYNAQMNNFDI